MNRHDRRKKRSQERKARRTGDTMGAVYHQLSDVPEAIRNSPGFRRGQDAAQRGEGFPPEYVAFIETAAKKIAEWLQSEPRGLDLRWKEQKQDGTFIAAALPNVIDWIADSPDARRLLVALDEATAHQLSMNQTIWALRMIRLMPMPDGSYWNTELLRESAGMAELRAFARGTGKTTRISGSPCPHCGAHLDHASSAEGTEPKPGSLTVCVKCGGVTALTDALAHRVLTEEEWATLHPETRAQIEDMSALIRRKAMGTPKRGVEA